MSKDNRRYDGDMQVYFVRHGESEGNAMESGDGLSFKESDQLTEKGWGQSRELGKRLANEGLTHIITSKLGRAKQTAEGINETLHLPVETHEGIHEHVAPDVYETASPEERTKLLPQFWMPEHDDDPDFSLEGAESFNQIIGRVKDFQEFLVERAGDRRLLVVSHGHFLRFFVGFTLLRDELRPRHFAELARAFKTANTGISIFEYSTSRRIAGYPDKTWRLVTWMDQQHL